MFPRGLPPGNLSKSRPDTSAPPRPRLLDGSTPQKDDNWTQAPARNHNYWTRAPTTTTKTPQDRGPRKPPGSPRKPPGGPRKLQEPQEPQNAPKKPASTKRPSKRHASTRPAHTTPVKKTTGHERPPRPRLLDASTPQPDDNWAQAPARNHNYWTRAPTTTTKTPQDRGP